MLENIFISILNMSLVSSFAILFVIIARYLLKKAPKIYSYSLWSFVLFRLVCPDSFLSSLSIMPINSKPISQDIIYSQTPSINTGIEMIDNSVSAVLPTATPYSSMNPMQGLMYIGIFVWIIGIAALITYSIISLVKLKSQLNGRHYKENIYFCDDIKTPFVIGFFKPKIYLPSQIKEDELEYVILHEKTHIKRLDHIVRIISFLALCLHWFNPLVWLAFYICGKDMEMSCDESVIKRLGYEIKKEYSTSLLSFTTGKRIINATPLAFGEGDTKGRIKNLLSYKKPVAWVSAILVLAIIILGILLLGNKISEQKDHVDLSDISTMSMGTEVPTLLYCQNNVAIMHGTFGYLAYDLSVQEPISRLSNEKMKENDIHFPRGDVSQDAKGIYIFDLADSVKSAPPYTHYYDIEKGTLEKVSSKHPGMAVIPHQPSENDGKYNEFFDDYHTSSTLVEKESSFFYLRSRSFDMKDLELVEQSYDNSNGNVWIIFPKLVELKEGNLEKLYSYKTEYIGDNVKVGNMCSNLPVPDTLTPNGIELSTDKEPYGLTINYLTDSVIDDTTYLNYNAAILFSLIKNLDVLTVNISSELPKITTPFNITREFIEDEVMKTDLWEAASSLKDFKSTLSSFISKYVEYTAFSSTDDKPTLSSSADINSADLEGKNKDIEKAQKAVAISNVELAKGEATLKTGSKAEVKLVMTQGEKIRGEDAGFGGGIGEENYIGDCEIQVYSNGSIITRNKLNRGGKYIFNMPFEIKFSDINGDKNPDFSIGQWGSSSIKVYTIYSVDEMRRVWQISDTEAVASSEYTDEDIYSVPFKGRNGKVSTVFYDNANNEMKEAEYELKFSDVSDLAAKAEKEKMIAELDEKISETEKELAEIRKSRGNVSLD